MVDEPDHSSLRIADHFRMPRFIEGTDPFGEGDRPPHFKYFYFGNAFSALSQRGEISRWVNGIFNSKIGGVVLFGIEKDKVKGLSLGDMEKRLYVSKTYSEVAKIWPPLDLNEKAPKTKKLYHVEILPVYEGDGKTLKSGRCIMAIVVRSPDPFQLYALKKDGETYVYNEDGDGKLLGPLKQEEISKIITARKSKLTNTMMPVDKKNLPNWCSVCTKKDSPPKKSPGKKPKQQPSDEKNSLCCFCIPSVKKKKAP